MNARLLAIAQGAFQHMDMSYTPRAVSKGKRKENKPCAQMQQTWIFDVLYMP